jgi:SAM-dependent methyltransferase
MEQATSNDRNIVMKQLWETSFRAQIATQAYNTAPVEAVIRTVAYYLRARYSSKEERHLHFLEMGCGAGPNLAWLARRGIRVSGVDISPTALSLCLDHLRRTGVEDRIGVLWEGSVTETPFPDESVDGVIEACVFQHLPKPERQQAFAEVVRVLKPGGVFVGYMLDQGHTTFQQKRSEQLPDDPGSLLLYDNRSNFYLTNIGLAHFFLQEEYPELLKGCSMIDPCLTTYYLPREEARKRGYESYLQSMWTVYAVK